MKRGIVAATLMVATAFAMTGLWSAVTDEPEQTLEQRTREVASTLRCPTCVGESIADSAAPVAGAMRVQTQEQLAAGRTPDEVRAWFAQRYGEGIVLSPPARGLPGLLWSIPAGLAVVAVGALLRRRGARDRWIVLGAAMAAAAVLVVSWTVRELRPAPLATVAAVDAEGDRVLEAAVAQDPGDAQLRLAYGLALDAEGRHEEAAGQFASASRLEPFDPDVRYLWASTLVRQGDVESADAALAEALRVSPDHSPSLLLRGVLLWRTGDEAARALLERFLALEPDDPAAADVEAMLRGDGDAPPWPE